ncbi:uncharacterized protein LOC143911061 [Arctopsyche grandis]|uniref:uncharacterized protein LOC143911061 n=1 Tax=Arctopsyche grandis TaxID=121162 RepID=UPI00406D9B2F
MKIPNLIFIFFIGLVSIHSVVEAALCTINIEENFEDETLGLLKENCPNYQKFEVTPYEGSNLESPTVFKEYFANATGSACSQTENVKVTSGSEVKILFSSMGNVEITGSLLIEIFDAEYPDMVIESEEIQINDSTDWTWKSWTLETGTVIKTRLTFKSLEETSFLAIDKLIIIVKEDKCLMSEATLDPKSRKESNNINDAIDEWKIISVVAVSLAGVALVITIVASILVVSGNKKFNDNNTYQNDLYPVTQTIIPRVDSQKYFY